MSQTESSTPLEQVIYEVKKVIVGQDHLLERLIIALLAMILLPDLVLWLPRQFGYAG